MNPIQNLVTVLEFIICLLFSMLLALIDCYAQPIYYRDLYADDNVRNTETCRVWTHSAILKTRVRKVSVM